MAVRRRFPSSRLAILATLLCGAIAASAQVREQITVEEVDVPVYVVSHGKAVRNLTKDDFELYVNGKRQPIDYFEAVDFTESPHAAAATTPEKAPAPQPQLQDRRLFLFLFDLVYNRPAALDRSRHAAVEMVNHSLPGDLFAVATLTSGNGVVFASPFLRDRDAVRHAILRLRTSKEPDALATSIIGAEMETAQAWVTFVVPSDTDNGKRAGLMSEDVATELLALPKPEYQARAETLAKDQLRVLGDLASRLRGLDGYKHVILFSQGFHIDAQSRRVPAEFPEVAEMAGAFRSANAFLDTVDLTANATGAGDVRTMSSGKTPIPDSGNESLQWISAVTGGKWIHWKNALAPALDELSSSYSAAYRLGFKPVDVPNARNDIEVRVRNLPRGATVSFRKGFAGAASSRTAPLDGLRLADIIQNDTPQSGTPPEISVVGRRIDVVVPVIQLSKQFGAAYGANVMLYVFNSKGVPVLSREKKFEIPAQAAADLVIQQTLDLAPGSYVAKVLMRAGESLAFAKQPFEIGAAQPSQ
ncbi:MAG TPA: VWA domain-containing protein [Thermoanaerobaculia bacterium]|nr:VWA domain-containing protein [Thermoanaerobaculia bacterium]